MPLIRSCKKRVIARGYTQVVHSVGGTIVTNVTVSGISDLSKVVEKLTGFTMNSNINYANVKIKLTSLTNLQIVTSVYEPSATVTVDWEIVAAEGRVQRIEQAFNLSNNEVTANVTITDVGNMNTAKILVNGAAKTSGLAMGYTLLSRARLTSSTNLAMAASTAHTGTCYVPVVIDY